MTEANRLTVLTPTERRVAKLVSQGDTNAEIGSALYMAEKTVICHLTHIYTKLDFPSRIGSWGNRIRLTRLVCEQEWIEAGRIA